MLPVYEVKVVLLDAVKWSFRIGVWQLILVMLSLFMHSLYGVFSQIILSIIRFP